MTRTFILAAALALAGVPATAQQTGADGTGDSWYDYFAGYAESAVGLVLGSGQEGSDPAAADATSQPQNGSADTLKEMIGNLSTEQIQSLAGAASGILDGSGTAEGEQGQSAQPGGAGLPSLSALQGTLTSLFGGGNEGQNLAQIFSAVASLSPEQRDNILSGLTTHIPGLLDKAQKWWDSLSESDRQGYIQQIKDALSFVMGQVGGSPTP